MAGQGGLFGGGVAQPMAGASTSATPASYTVGGPTGETAPSGGFLGMMGGPSNVMPNGMSSGDVFTPGAAVLGVAPPVEGTAEAGGVLGGTPALAGITPEAAANGSGMGFGARPVFNNVATPVGRPPIAPQGGFNVNQAAAGGLQQAMQGTQNVMNAGTPLVQASTYNPAQTGATGYGAAQTAATGYDAAQAGNVSPVTANNVTAGQLSSTDLSSYTNPYEDQVVQATLDDLANTQLKTMNQIGAQADAAKAFGGSRHGLVESESIDNFAKQAANTAAKLRQVGYGQAQQAALQDIGNAMQANLANQGANLQAGTTSANLGQQINLANQGASNQAAQFSAGAANQAGLANQAASNTAAQFGAGALNTANLSNQAANNQAGQYNAGAMNAASLANQAALMGNQGQQLAAANQLGNLAGQAFNTGQTIAGQQQQAGLLQQGLQQALIDAAQGQFQGFANSPAAALSAPLAALGVAPVPQTTTQTNNPGLLNYLQVLAMM